MRIVMHGHHADALFSFYSSEEAVADRIAVIETEKPVEERRLRLALLKDVTDALPRNEARAAYVKAGAAYVKARAAYVKAGAAHDKSEAAHDKARAAYVKSEAAHDKARAAHVKTVAAYVKAWAAYMASFDAETFHREHCHPRCPWNGKTIFSRGVGIEVLEGVTA